LHQSFGIKDEFEAYVWQQMMRIMVTRHQSSFRQGYYRRIIRFRSTHSYQPIPLLLILTRVAGVAAQISFTTATGLGTAAMKAQALAAQKLHSSGRFKCCSKSNSLGIILAALAAVVVAYVVFNDELEKIKKLTIQ
jgi:hypothetical protein